MVKLIVNPRSETLRQINVDTTPNTRVRDIVVAYGKANNSLSSSRIRFTKLEEDAVSKKPKHVTLDYEKSLAQNGIVFTDDSDSKEVYAKDLGPQISWKLVFLIEYVGPLIIHPLLYYGWFKPDYNTLTQKVSFILVMLHFLKREYETTFVHLFSSDTMPLFNVFKNSAHYWILSGLSLAVTIYAPDSYRNNLRADGSREHKIPYGYGFNLVSFPNYFFESVAWLAFALLNNNWSSWVFLTIASIQMYIWAAKKHKRYLKEFGDQYPKNRKAMIPFLL
ncbi:Enoyl reductase that catalyzes the last step in each cycle of very long chain fatty acid elongation [Komagataella phaffii GS115]|uniref:Enoyl reductase that catalyzes the last step in each cycle of very long chain fatty acid elongation n=1 Tax=Komagataella phaffii (strain GS115 / ATCC 20864) TaxID=644223 RepID=C4R8X1_KOMPG|nr:Enoyl reductase that catalyzes the last step in each cycle of very long chain fatty acid elongation [Komagataella phaffii GS115]CAY72046.1 Enoyl reductase that catalyzes the last step in each cycle of very long chain fatty acid elongation [Komagataella phaffii GS115]